MAGKYSLIEVYYTVLYPCKNWRRVPILLGRNLALEIYTPAKIISLSLVLYPSINGRRVPILLRRNLALSSFIPQHKW